MANNKMIISEKVRNLGQFQVGRLLPFPAKRQVGPFTFIDHMGPAVLHSGQYIEVDQHPHIGLSTLTYLFQGAIHHRDSTGADQVVTPGGVGLMTAGRGVTHTERTPSQDRTGEPLAIHGYQVWIALPKEKEEVEPHFQYLPADKVPQIQKGELKIRLIAGEAFGLTSPLLTYSPLFMVDLFTTSEMEVDLGKDLYGEIAWVVVQGQIQVANESVTSGEMMVAMRKETCKVQLKSNTRILLFGGEPLPEPRHLYWNFVSSSKELIEQAKEDWRMHRFPQVQGDTTYIEMP